MRHDAEKFAMDSLTLAAEEIEALEARVRAEPDDADARLRLLGAYLMKRMGEPDTMRRRAPHALWVIERHPGHPIAGSPLCEFWSEEPDLPAATAAWERAIERNPETPAVVLNAARFFTHPDRRRSRELLERGERLAPGNPAWAELLGHDRLGDVKRARMMANEGRLAFPPELRAVARAALIHFERALTLSDERLRLLALCVHAAVEAEDWEAARRHADAVLVAVAGGCDDEHRLDYLHAAYIARGHAALARNDEEGACGELAAAGRQGGRDAPTLRSYGPDFRLATLLLERGRKDAVLSYLAWCGEFWKPKRVQAWRREIVEGRLPRMHPGA